MLVQHRPNALRLIRQHDHALAAGRMALAWREPGNGHPLSLALVLATALHDAPWRGADRRPRLGPHGGLPYDFATYPQEEKYAFIARGLDELAGLHPSVGVLVSLHHESFLPPGALSGFRQREEVRREALRRMPALGPSGGGDEERDLARLQLFDNLSLFLCLTAPGTSEATVPGWLEKDSLFRIPGHGAGTLHRSWRSPEELALDPFPFGGSVLLEIPYRDLGEAGFSSEEALVRAWEAAPDGTWRVRLVPG